MTSQIDIQIERITEMRGRGISHQEIFLALGWGEKRYYRFIRRHGIATPRAGYKRFLPDVKVRECMNPSCNHKFKSTGAHHRFCDDCRRVELDLDDLPYGICPPLTCYMRG